MNAVLLVSGERVESMNHTNDSALKDARCVATCRWKTQIKILWLFKNFSSDVASRDGNS